MNKIDSHALQKRASGKIAATIGEKAGLDPEDPVLLETIRQRFGFDDVEPYYNENLLQTPYEINGGESDLLVEIADEATDRLVTKYLTKKGVKNIAAALGWLSGKAVGTVGNILDPSPLGDDTYYNGVLLKQNAEKIRKIDKVMYPWKR